MLVVLAWAPMAGAARVDRSDLSQDNTVDGLDLEAFSSQYLKQDAQAVDWCAFYTSSVQNERYFRGLTSDSTANYDGLLSYVAATYNCQLSASSTQGAEKSDLNGDGKVDLADLVLFSENYLGKYWETVDWCLFYGSTLAGVDFEGSATRYYLQHFTQLLSFINTYFGCGGGEPPPSLLVLENSPKYLARVSAAPNAGGDFYITDPVVGSLFIYDAFMVLKAEIKGLNKPLGVAVDSLGRILVGNDGRDNIEVYDPATGELLAAFGDGLVKMPTAITLDALGNIYVTDSRSNNIRVFDPTYLPLRTIGKAGSGQDRLNFPVDAQIIVGGAASQPQLFVADQGNDRVQVYDLQGNWLRSITFAGTPGQNCHWFTGVCQIPGLPEFNRLQALATDSLGRLHVLDNFAATIVIFDPASGEALGAYGGYGADAGLLRVPMDILISATDTAIVTAGDKGRIEIFAIQ